MTGRPANFITMDRHPKEVELRLHGAAELPGVQCLIQFIRLIKPLPKEVSKSVEQRQKRFRPEVCQDTAHGGHFANTPFHQAKADVKWKSLETSCKPKRTSSFPWERIGASKSSTDHTRVRSKHCHYKTGESENTHTVVTT